MAPAILHHSQSVATELKAGSGITNVPFISQQESAEEWLKYEHLLYSCLTTGDDKSASLCLERLEKRFGATNEKVRSLRGMYNEAQADAKKVEELLRGYDKELATSPANIPLAKRRITLLRSLGKEVEAVTALNKLLDISPTDIEAWAELAEIYVSLKMPAQALHCLAEVLLVQPNAWNVHARYGEVCLMSSPPSEDKAVLANRLVAALQHYARSVELCEEYIRGCCGLKQTAKRILELERTTPGTFDDRDLTAANRLLEQTNAKLHEIAENYPTDCEAPDVLAVRLMLD